MLFETENRVSCLKTLGHSLGVRTSNSHLLHQRRAGENGERLRSTPSTPFIRPIGPGVTHNFQLNLTTASFICALTVLLSTGNETVINLPSSSEL